MFNYCVWYSLNRNHSLSKLIKRLSQQLESEYFNGHITIASHRNYEEALEQTKKFALIEYSTKLVDRLQEGCNNNINKLLELKNLWPIKLQSVVEKLENNELR